jgi:hypothetical protein
MMKSKVELLRFCVAVFVLALLAGLGGAQFVAAQAAPQQAPAAAPAAAPAPQQAQPACANSPLCYEGNDFAATITSFRTSAQGAFKVIDVVMRFQNKTSAPVILGYVVSSGIATDDRGNRYIVWGQNGYRGIGLVNNANNFDPRFSLRAGGFADAQFELMWAPGQTVYGLTFQLDMTVDEINTVEGNQHTMGGEFPLHFQGLTNGAGGTSPTVTSLIPGANGTASGGNTAAAAGTAAGGTAAASATQAACNTANQTGAAAAVSNAANTVANIGSLFGKRKAAQNTGQASNTAAGCPPNNTTQAPAANTANQAGAIPVANTTQAPAANTANQAGAKPVANTIQAPAANTANQAGAKPAANTTQAPAANTANRAGARPTANTTAPAK